MSYDLCLLPQAKKPYYIENKNLIQSNWFHRSVQVF